MNDQKMTDKYEILFEGRLKRKIITFPVYLKRKEHSEENSALFIELRNRILQLGGEIEERPNEGYVAYLYHNLHFCCAWFGYKKKAIRINIENIEKLNDPHEWAKIVSVETANKSYYFDISKKEDILYAISLITQAYQSVCEPRE